MSYKFPSDAWVKELEVKLNNSDGYKKAAAKWEGALLIVILQEASLDEDHYLYIDLWHGDAKDARELNSAGEEEAPFELTAPLSTWKSVITGQLDPIKAITSRKLKLRGNMLKIVKSPKAAIELVKCCGEIDTEWPS